MQQVSGASRRQRMEAVFEGGASELPPVSIRLDLWHKDAVSCGKLPREVAGMSFEQVEDYLGFARAARFRRQPKIVFPDCKIVETRTATEILKEYHFPQRTLINRVGYTAEMERQGLRAHSLEYPLREREDYEAMLAAMKHAHLEFEGGSFAEFDAATGDAGLPMFILGPSAAHSIMISWAGYENFYLHQTDFADLVDELIAELEKLYWRDLYPYAQASGAKLFLHGVHFSSQMTPKPIFRKYFLPYFRKFNARMHEKGRKVLFHADAECFDLRAEVMEAEFDGADCLATTPLVPRSLEEYLEAWRGTIVCWGGLPSTIFDATFPAKDYEQHVLHTVKVMRGRSDCILGASDNVMPGADWERLKLLAQLTKSRSW